MHFVLILNISKSSSFPNHNGSGQAFCSSLFTRNRKQAKIDDQQSYYGEHSMLFVFTLKAIIIIDATISAEPPSDRHLRRCRWSVRGKRDCMEPIQTMAGHLLFFSALSSTAHTQAHSGTFSRIRSYATPFRTAFRTACAQSCTHTRLASLCNI